MTRNSRARIESGNDVLTGCRVQPLERGQDVVADDAPRRGWIRGIDPERQALRAAVALGLLAPQGQERTDDAVLAPDANAGRRPARGEPVEDRLDLVGGRVASCAQSVGGEAVTKLAQLGLRPLSGRGRVHDLGPEPVAAEAGVLLGLRAAKPMVDVERADAVAEGPKCMPEARRVGAPRDQAEHLAAGRNELVPADVLFDPRTENAGVHEQIVGSG